MVGAVSDQNVDLEAVKDEAALWVARLRGGDCTLQDERAFRTWLTADPAHATATQARDNQHRQHRSSQDTWNSQFVLAH